MEGGLDPAESSVRLMLVGGEPGTGVKNTRDRLQGLWGATMAEFYGCTGKTVLTAAGTLVPRPRTSDGTISTHLVEDIQIWELVDPDVMKLLKEGERGLTVCTNLRIRVLTLRFLVGDYTFNKERCDCGEDACSGGRLFLRPS